MDKTTHHLVSPYVLKPRQKTFVSIETYIDAHYIQYESLEMTVSPVMTTNIVKDLPIGGDSIREKSNNVVYLTGQTKNNSKRQ